MPVGLYASDELQWRYRPRKIWTKSGHKTIREEIKIRNARRHHHFRYIYICILYRTEGVFNCIYAAVVYDNYVIESITDIMHTSVCTKYNIIIIQPLHSVDPPHRLRSIAVSPTLSLYASLHRPFTLAPHHSPPVARSLFASSACIRIIKPLQP